MKYIRTEYGHIYEYVEIRIYPSQYHKFGLYRHNLNSEYELIIAQSDTIEELCDCYVGIIDNQHSIIENLTLKGIRVNLMASGKQADIYGAIWTDKGLIYVAKLNENGKLELI